MADNSEDNRDEAFSEQPLMPFNMPSASENDEDATHRSTHLRCGRSPPDRTGHRSPFGGEYEYDDKCDHEQAPLRVRPFALPSPGAASDANRVPGVDRPATTGLTFRWEDS